MRALGSSAGGIRRAREVPEARARRAGAHQASTMSASAGAATDAATSVLSVIRIVYRAARGVWLRERANGTRPRSAIARRDRIR